MTLTNMKNLHTFISSRKAELIKLRNMDGDIDYYDTENFLEASLTELAKEMEGLVPEEKETRGKFYPEMDMGFNSCREETLRRMREYLSGNEKGV